MISPAIDKLLFCIWHHQPLQKAHSQHRYITEVCMRVLNECKSRYIPTIRENKFVEDLHRVERKLSNQLSFAAMKMFREPDKAFSYFHYGDSALSIDVGPIQVSCTALQGTRPRMEDTVLCSILTLNICGREEKAYLTAIFDGHGGSTYSRYLEHSFAKHLQNEINIIGNERRSLDKVTIWNALKLTFVHMQKKLLERLDTPAPRGGSTAIVCLIIQEQLWTACLGDSRAILVGKDNCVQLSEDALPTDARYLKSIKKRHGMVERGRILSKKVSLEPARAFGDFDVPGVSQRPKITVFPLMLSDVVILACDGLWNVAASRQIAQAIQQRVDISLSQLSNDIANSAFISGSRDNITVVAIKLRPPPSR